MRVLNMMIDGEHLPRQDRGYTPWEILGIPEPKP